MGMCALHFPLVPGGYHAILAFLDVPLRLPAGHGVTQMLMGI